jgi:transcriptional regulator ATRX
MEDKIYSRCVSKLSLSSRVVDEHQIERHYTSADLAQLYAFEVPSSLAESQELPTLPKVSAGF